VWKLANCDAGQKIRTIVTFVVSSTENAIRPLLLSHFANQNADLRPVHLRLPATLNPLTTEEMPNGFRLQLHILSASEFSGGGLQLGLYSRSAYLSGALPDVHDFLTVAAVVAFRSQYLEILLIGEEMVVSQSEPWWTEDLAELRKKLGRERRRPAGIGRVQNARRNLRRAIRKAKRECWNRFLQDAGAKEVWTAAGYTTPRIDKTGQTLVSEDGSIAESQEEREHAIMEAHFPRAPPGSSEPRVGGVAFERVDAHLVGTLLAKAANTSAPGDDRISVDIVKVFWQWDRQRIVQLVRTCIRLGYHPKLWRTAKGVVIPKPGKPDYTKVRAYRVISLLGVISKLVERTAAHLYCRPPGTQAQTARLPVWMSQTAVLR